MSNNKQKSSVDELWDYLKGWIPQGQYAGVREVYLEAKAMHKEEIINFGNDLLAQNDNNYIGMPNLAEQYYNETFGGNNEQQ